MLEFARARPSPLLPRVHLGCVGATATWSPALVLSAPPRSERQTGSTVWNSCGWGGGLQGGGTGEGCMSTKWWRVLGIESAILHFALG
jgi:hypothetical protein